MFRDPDTVSSRHDFVEYVASLLSDFKQNGQQWENQTLENFLEAVSGYAEDVPGYLANTHSRVDPEKPSWQLFAIILAGAHCYE